MITGYYTCPSLALSSRCTPPAVLSHFCISDDIRHYQMASPSASIELQDINADSQPTREQVQEPSISQTAPDHPSAGPQHGGTEGVNAPDCGRVSAPSFPWKVPSIEVLQKEFSETYTQADKDSALERTIKVVKDYSDETVKRWKEEIDTILVYAGLFSAILTAFNVQSYILLQPSTPDPTLAVLQQISLQLNSFSVNPPGALVNSTHPVTPFAPIPTAPVEAWTVWLNSLWFSALICSLASASIGILVKQWLHEYEAGISGTSVEIARLRQFRLNHLEKWRVAEIIAILPVLLQVSLALFLAGILILLWHLHPTVATIASTLIGVLLSFVVVTTVMPVIWSDCCYLSPPTYAIFRVVHRIHYLVTSLRKVVEALHNLSRYLSGLDCLPVFVRWWCRCLRDWAELHPWGPVTVPTWRGREQTVVQQSSSKLDVDMIIEAYSTTMDVNYLSETAARILADKDDAAVVQCFGKIADINGRHFGDRLVPMRSPDFWAGALIHASREQTLEGLPEHIYMMRVWYRDNMKSGHLERLLLALAATLANPHSGSHARRGSQWLLDAISTFKSAALELMPWKAVCHVAAAVEMWLRELLHPSDGEPAQEPDWYVVFWCLRILARCCFAPVSSWQRSRGETKALIAYIFGIDFLQKGSISEIAGKLSWWFDAQAMLETLDLILTYLGESEDARRGTPGDFLEAVGELVTYIDGEASRDSWPWNHEDVQEALKNLKRSFEKCKSLGLGVGAEEASIQAFPLDPQPGSGAIGEHPVGH